MHFGDCRSVLTSVSDLCDSVMQTVDSVLWSCSIVAGKSCRSALTNIMDLLVEIANLCRLVLSLMYFLLGESVNMY